jgi:hypothetical protein
LLWRGNGGVWCSRCASRNTVKQEGSPSSSRPTARNPTDRQSRRQASYRRRGHKQRAGGSITRNCSINGESYDETAEFRAASCPVLLKRQRSRGCRGAACRHDRVRVRRYHRPCPRFASTRRMRLTRRRISKRFWRRRFRAQCREVFPGRRPSDPAWLSFPRS